MRNTSKSISIFTILFCLCKPVFSQNGAIAGKIFDEVNNETLIGSTVMIEGMENYGVVSDIDGNYLLSNVPEGSYVIVISYISYQTKKISDVIVEKGKVTTLDITLSGSTTELETVVITSTFNKETIQSILTLQKNNISISDGISRDIIQRSPDKNTGEVLKRLSGTTLMDGKFAVIRGLSDRYNTAMINGNILPSTEPDRKTFAFDLFPSNMLDNLFIYKTAQPDLPGDFAGGIIQLNTRDIPIENFISFSAGTGINFQTTFKPYFEYRGGNTDWLGIDDGTRAIPDAFPTTSNYNNHEMTTDFDRAEYSKLFNNNWGALPYGASPLDQSYQFAGGFVKEINRDQIGIIGALTYNNSRSTIYAYRKDFDSGANLKYEFEDAAYKQSVLAGSLLNISYKLGENNKFSLKNSFSINGNDNTTIRKGLSYDYSRDVDYEYYEFISNILFTSVFSGDHYLPVSKIKITWSAGINHLSRDQPDLRTSLYYKGFEPVFEGDTAYQTFVFYNPTPDGNFRFWSYLEEISKHGTLAVSYPFNILKKPQSFKAGAMILNKNRDFSARLLGYVVGPNFYSNPEYNLYLTQPRDEIFAEENISENIFYLEDVTTMSDSYTAEQECISFYGMLDNNVGENLRIVWGARAEFFTQKLHSFFNSASSDPDPIDVSTKKLDILPSINFIYSLSNKTNIRVAGSKTVIRPELREFAPFGYYDYEASSFVVGNPDLLSTDIYNADLRFEYFPGFGQIVSMSLFYKKFINPIELRKYDNDVYKQSDPINEDESRNYGVEFELRKNFAFINKNQFFNNLTFNTNVALINSLVQVEDTAYYGISERPLQGQSPFVINAGFTYFNPENGFSVTALYNIIGRRIRELGYKNYSDIFENPRPQLDAQFSIPLLKESAILRFTWSDILSKDVIYYQDSDNSGNYNSEKDNTITQLNYGSKVSLSFAYKF